MSLAVLVGKEKGERGDREEGQRGEESKKGEKRREVKIDMGL